MNRQQARNNLLNAVRLVVEATKTVEYFVMKLSGMVRDLYRGDIEEADFVDGLASLVEDQLTRAWREGMRENDLDPDEDMEPEWQTILDDIILNEYNYVDGFAADIVAARDEQLDWGPLLSRAELWANRYNDVVSQSVIATGKGKLLWVYGDTDHCTTCERLNGIVAWTEEWEEAGVRPQSPPNDLLECGGWRCQCTLVPTGNRHTRNALDAILDATKSYKGWVTINGNHVLIGEEGDEGGGESGRSGGGEKPIWVGDKVITVGDDIVANGRFNNKDKWAVVRQDGMSGPFEDTIEKAVSENNRLLKESLERQGIYENRETVLGHIREGNISEADIQNLTHGYEYMTDSSVIGVARQLGLRDKDARIILSKLRLVRISAGGANLRDPREFLEKVKEALNNG